MKGLWSLFFLLVCVYAFAQNDSIPPIPNDTVPLVDSLQIDSAATLHSDSTTKALKKGNKTDSTSTKTIAVNTDSSSLKKTKKPKQPFMGGIFQEPPNLEHSPKKAMLRSLMFPGLGQIYNKQYIKVPFVWAAVGGVGFYTYQGRKEYIFFRDLYRSRVNGMPWDTLSHITDNVIIDVRDKARKQMEQGFFIFLGVYLLNGIEAFTAAHLLNFDISDDLTLRIQPDFELKPSLSLGSNSDIGNSMQIGIKFTIQPRPPDKIHFVDFY